MIAAEYEKLTARVDALQLRERVLILVASVVFVFFVADSFGLQPIFDKQNLLLQDIQARELQLEVLRARSTHLYGDFSEEKSSPLTQLHQELTSFGQELQLRLDNMLSPDKAANILEQVMIHEAGLALTAVNTTQAPLTITDEDSGEIVMVDDIHRYELELQLEGGYLDTLNYLRALEALPWTFFWERIEFEITDHPIASIDLEIYTLGHTGI